jgi:TrwC relaxase
MTVHKLTAGDGYTYLTRQVAAHDVGSRGFETLGAYYTERGEAPGVWMGSGRAAVPDFPVAGNVTEEQMFALFGQGRHPNARALERSMRTAGASEKEIEAAGRLGSPYRVYEATQMLNRRAAGAFRDYNRDRGLHPDTRCRPRIAPASAARSPAACSSKISAASPPIPVNCPVIWPASPASRPPRRRIRPDVQPGQERLHAVGDRPQADR